ncbi:MAG: PAS domain S-box protein, partial [Chthoniobacterales bacterium]
MQKALAENEWNIVITDYVMPQFDAPAAIQILKDSERDIPIVVVSGTIGEDIAIETLKMGADDYLLKGNLIRLVPAVERSLEAASARRDKKALKHMKSLIMSNSLDMICTVNEFGKFTEVSAACHIMLGYRPAELLGEPFINFVYPADVEDTQDVAEAVMQGRPTKDFENRYVRKDGTLVSIMWSAFWSKEDNMLIAVARDITERKRNEEALLLRERALGEVSQGVLICDENRLIIYANSSFTSITGYTEAELLGVSCAILQGADTDPGTISKIRAAIREGKPFEGEILNYRKDGRAFWNDLSIAPIHSQVGGPIRFIGIQRDVTERKRAEQDLNFALERLQLAVKAGRVGTWEFNLLTGKVDWDDQMLALYGKTAENIEPGPERWANAMHPEDRAFMEVIYQEVLHEGKESFETEFRISRGDDGRQCYIRAMGIILRDKSGSSLRMIGINWDVTEERQREEKLSEALANEKELSEKARVGERAKNEFLAVMSHEVRTPLNGILGFSQLLAETPDLSQESREHVETITSSGQALLHILDDVLDFSRLSAERLQIESVRFAPREVMDDVCALFICQVNEKDLNLAVVIEEDIPSYLQGDAGRLRQILINLVGNALKFTEHGSITLSLRTENEGRFIFSVKDTGVGVAPDQADRIFEPFTQADSSISRKYGGTGLGLSISRRLAELMDGTLELESQYGKSSNFILTLPFETVIETSNVISEVMSRTFDTGFAILYPLHILVVEDDKVNLKLALSLIRRLGYDPIATKNGREAVDTHKREHPDCVLMDLQMPEMDGIVATEQIRALEKEHPGGKQSF